MAEKTVSTEDIKKLANDVDADNAESVNKFLAGVDEKFKGLPEDERARKMNLLTAELEHKGVLPNLLVTAGLADSNSEKYNQMKEANGSDLKKEDLENMSKNGKKGFYNVDGAAQFLAGAILRNFDGKTGISAESSSHTFGISDGKVDYKQIKRWAEREKTELGDRKGVENAILQWDSIAKKLETDKPKKDDVQALLKADKFSGNKMLTAEERQATQFLLDKFDTVRSIDNSSFRPYSYDDWISKDKLEYWGTNKLHTSGDVAQQRKTEREQLVKDTAAEAAKDKERIAKASTTSPADNERIKKLEEMLVKQQELIDKLTKLQQQPPVGQPQPPRVEVTPPVVQPQPPRVEVRPPVVQPQPPRVEVRPPVVQPQPPQVEVRPPVVQPQPPRVEVQPQPPRVEVRPPVVQPQPPRDWAKEEEDARKEVERLLIPRNQPAPPVRR